jgi:hypothetical protein
MTRKNPRRVFISGQALACSEMRRRSAIEPVIGHLQGRRPLDRRCLKDSADDAANAILWAVGCNFRRIRVWLRVLWYSCEPSRASYLPERRPTTEPKSSGAKDILVAVPFYSGSAQAIPKSKATSQLGIRSKV